jgi:hypothetical protein
VTAANVNHRGEHDGQATLAIPLKTDAALEVWRARYLHRLAEAPSAAPPAAAEQLTIPEAESVPPVSRKVWRARLQAENTGQVVANLANRA